MIKILFPKIYKMTLHNYKIIYHFISKVKVKLWIKFTRDSKVK